MKKHCEMCLGAFDPAMDVRKHTQYCSFCCPNGKLIYVKDDIHDFRKRYFNKLYAEGVNEFVARFHTLMIGSAPYWKAKRR